MSSDLIKQAQIMIHVDRGKVETNQETAQQEKEMWATGLSEYDKGVTKAYEAVEKGEQLIDLHKAILAGGKSSSGNGPSLAIAPYGAKKLVCRTYREGDINFKTKIGLSKWKYKLEFPQFTGWDKDTKYRERITAVPYIPPNVRNAAEKNDLILFEAQWRMGKDFVDNRDRDFDPALLRPIVGTLYVVKAAWELTDLEAAALRAGF